MSVFTDACSTTGGHLIRASFFKEPARLRQAVAFHCCVQSRCHRHSCEMTSVKLIVTHPGSSHKDEFLACSVLLALYAVPVFRREPGLEDLQNPECCVVDVGHQHDPALNNYDHHQFPKDYPPTCSLSLVLQSLDLYDDALEFCDWLKTAEWFDCRGPVSTSQWLGVAVGTLSKLVSPIDLSLLRRFSLLSRLEPGEPLWEIMRMVGADLLDYLRQMRARLNYIATHAKIWNLEIGGDPAKVLFLPRGEPNSEDSSLGIDRYIEMNGLSGQVIGVVTPDRRGNGYGLARYRDNARLDFTRIAQHPKVHFAHARGFVAKTSSADVAELKQLVTLSGAPY